MKAAPFAALALVIASACSGTQARQAAQKSADEPVPGAGGIVHRHVGLLRAQVTEQEVRALAHLPTAAEVSVVKDTGQVLKANAAYATEIPGIIFEGLTPGQKGEALKRLNTEMCTCG